MSVAVELLAGGIRIASEGEASIILKRLYKRITPVTSLDILSCIWLWVGFVPAMSAVSYKNIWQLVHYAASS